MGEAFEFEQLSRFFKPITKQAEKMTEKIEKGVKGLPGEIAKVLPRPISIMQQPPPYEAPFADTETPGELKEIGKELPNEVKKTENGYRIGNIDFNVDEKEKNILINKTSYSKSPKIYNILTDKKSSITWNDLDKYEKKDFANLVVNSNVLYSDYENSKYNQFDNSVKWKNLYSPIWYNRFLYMKNERLNNPIEKKTYGKIFTLF